MPKSRVTQPKDKDCSFKRTKAHHRLGAIPHHQVLPAVVDSYEFSNEMSTWLSSVQCTTWLDSHSCLKVLTQKVQVLLYFHCHAYERHSNAKGQINQKGQECKWKFLPISAAPLAKSKYAAASMHFGRTGAFTQTHSLNIHIHPFTKSTTLSTPNKPVLSCRPPSVHWCPHKSPSDSSSPSMAAQPWHPPPFRFF